MSVCLRHSLQMSRKDQKEPSGSNVEGIEAIAKSGRNDPRIRVCAATPPQTQRRFFSPKLKSPFNKRRTGLGNVAATTTFKPSSNSRVLSGKHNCMANDGKALTLTVTTRFDLIELISDLRHRC